MFTCHGVISVATGVSLYRVVETKIRFKHLHRGAQIMLWSTCRGMNGATTNPDCVSLPLHHLGGSGKEKLTYIKNNGSLLLYGRKTGR